MENKKHDYKHVYVFKNAINAI